jgi:anti-anti-sigma factor
LLSNESLLRRRRRDYLLGVVTIERSDRHFVDEAPFGCTVHRHGSTSAIELEGELDLAAKPTLEAAMDTAVDPGPVETVVVDFTGVRFADSTTLAWLVAAEARMRSAGGRLVAVAGPGPVLDLLHLTGLDRRLTLVDNGPMR